MEQQLHTIPVFPLPDFVALTGNSHEFHIFEPRYRKMIADCLENKWELGISLAIKEISTPSPEKDYNKIIKSNRSVYEPARVFGAGKLTLLERLKDGRLLVKVEDFHRMEIKKVVQSLPYYVVEATRKDEPLGELCRAEVVFDRLVKHLNSLFSDKFSVQPFSKTDPLTSLNEVLNALSKSIQFDSGLAQMLLEQDTMVDRTEALERVLDSVVMQLNYEKKPLPQHSGEEGKVVKVDFQKKAKI